MIKIVFFIAFMVLLGTLFMNDLTSLFSVFASGFGGITNALKTAMIFIKDIFGYFFKGYYMPMLFGIFITMYLILFIIRKIKK